MSEHLHIQRDSGLLTLRMHRPDKKNALKSDMYTAMTEALIKGDASPDVTSHLFVGSGGVFTAGSCTIVRRTRLPSCSSSERSESTKPRTAALAAQ